MERHLEVDEFGGRAIRRYDWERNRVPRWWNGLVCLVGAKDPEGQARGRRVASHEPVEEASLRKLVRSPLQRDVVNPRCAVPCLRSPMEKECFQEPQGYRLEVLAIESDRSAGGEQLPERIPGGHLEPPVELAVTPFAHTGSRMRTRSGRATGRPRRSRIGSPLMVHGNGPGPSLWPVRYHRGRTCSPRRVDWLDRQRTQAVGGTSKQYDHRSRPSASARNHRPLPAAARKHDLTAATSDSP